MTAQRTLTAVAIVLAAATVARAEDWPTYRHDNRRSGGTAENLRLPLTQIWRYDAPSAPVPAWTAPARWDAYAGMRDPKPMRDFDAVFAVTVAGDAVFFASSADDAAHCLDAATGKAIWTSYTDAPVRLPPTIAGGHAYFGSDDGRVYCVKASDGSAVWTYRAAPVDRRVPSNGKLVSLWPVRTGVLVAEGKAYFAASLFPWRTSHVCALDARTGKDAGPGLFKVSRSGLTIQGALLASDSQIFAPQGRSPALVFSRTTGKPGRPLGGKGDGGVHALLTKDSHLIYGPGSKTGWLTVRDPAPRRLGGAIRMAMSAGGETAYIYTPGALSTVKYAQHSRLIGQIHSLAHGKHRPLAARLKALSRPPKRKKGAPKETPEQAAKRKADYEAVRSELDKVAGDIKRLQQAAAACVGWKVACPPAYELIVAGETVFLGADGAVHALSARDGKQVWKAKVDGRARGLAAANGRLHVSTDKGKIHCFASR